MSKYLTRRCIGIHVVTLLLVSSFILAAWWQYDCAVGGNGLSWAYVFEWPAFAVYAVYMWWKLIHDKRTAFDRLWAAKQHAAADAYGTPLYQIPGWALDKTLYREVVASSLEAARSPALSPLTSGVVAPSQLGDGQEGEQVPVAGALDDERAVDGPDDRAGQVIDARVVGVKVHVDEELNAYNRYLGELSWSDPPKRWGARGRRRDDAGGDVGTPVSPSAEGFEGECSELPAGDRDASFNNELGRR
jgi:hypothetical protein